MKIAAIYNPVSGNNEINILKDELIKGFVGHELNLWKTNEPLHAINLAKKAVQENFDIIVAIGGDGTITEVISGMIGSKAKLGIIPFGTGNMLAGNLGIPINIPKAIEIILNENSQKIDIGKINDRYFAFMAGCGFDAKIIGKVSKKKKRKLGFFAYFIEGFIQSIKPKYAVFKIKLNNNRTIKVRGLATIIANSGDILGDLLSLFPNASFDDGLLDLLIISPKGIIDYLPIIWKIIIKQPYDKSKKIQYFQAKQIEIKTKPSLFVQADGDIIGKTPIYIEIVPKAIEILIPAVKEENILITVDETVRSFINQTLEYFKTGSF
ncbi:MAG: diacylglycerol kinase family lipid kinase [Candidatus Gastranaerophilales bacterium]|nr:diacylglycerol kinase family lipid kinase [Candidatus Gastranaerophilales bacterium]